MRLGAVHYKILVALTIWIIINYLETRLSVLALSRRDKHSKLNVLLPSDVRKKMASEVKKLSELHSASIKLVFEGAFSNWCLPESCFCNQVLAYCCGDHIFSPHHFSHCGEKDRELICWDISSLTWTFSAQKSPDQTYECPAACTVHPAAGVTTESHEG